MVIAYLFVKAHQDARTAQLQRPCTKQCIWNGRREDRLYSGTSHRAGSWHKTFSHTSGDFSNTLMMAAFYLGLRVPGSRHEVFIKWRGGWAQVPQHAGQMTTSQVSPHLPPIHGFQGSHSNCQVSLTSAFTQTQELQILRWYASWGW